jgi:TatD DNase family protein
MEEHILNAEKRGVKQFFVPGSTIEDSAESIELSKKYPTKIYGSAGIHPYHASLASIDMMDKLERLASDPFALCVGECGLDYSDGFPAAELQLPCFEAQVELACKLQKPLFLHERLAHTPFCTVMDKFSGKLPPCLVHCFTGTEAELGDYLERGCFIGITGYILKPHGQNLRKWISSIPLDRLVVETDAPYLGFKGCRVGYAKDAKKQSPNVPSALPFVVEAVAECMGITPMEVAEATTSTARRFLGISYGY